MKTIKFNDKTTGESISLAYSDYGSGQPIVLVHGWPLSREMWEYQLGPLVEAGYRVIKYDRRGFGKSSKPWNGYDYDSLSDDLNELFVQLDLRKAFLVGFSMGGGEVVRYIARYGEERLAGIGLISSIIPFMKKTETNPEGVDESVFEDMITGIKEDRIGYLEDFGKKFFGIGFLNKPVSSALLRYYLDLQAKASARSTIESIRSFSATDFRKEVKMITVPTLIVHGDSDNIVPIEVSSNRTATMIPHSEMLVLVGAPHGLFYTHKEALNRSLLQFFKGEEQDDPEPEIVPLYPPTI